MRFFRQKVLESRADTGGRIARPSKNLLRDPDRALRCSAELLYASAPRVRCGPLATVYRSSLATTFRALLQLRRPDQSIVIPAQAGIQSAGHAGLPCDQPAVIPAQAGIHLTPSRDSRFRGNDSIETGRKALCALFLILFTSTAFAGAQKEEELAESVRTALAAAIADEAPRTIRHNKIEERIPYLHWVGDMSDKLRKRRTELDARARRELLEVIYYEAKRAGLEPSLVLGLIQVESNFRKYAISTAGARGLMQVMPFWTRQIGDGDARKLFHMQTNLRYGCTILRHYINRENGNLFLALGRYNGSRGQDPYPNAVLSAWENWKPKTDKP
jgi:hypothetical protein